MKKLFVITVVIMLVLIACGEKETETEDNPLDKKGPGGGIIISSHDGLYTECSEYLGTYNWYEALITVNNYRGGGFADWRLPNRNELKLLWSQKVIYDSKSYWSSDEYDNLNAWYSGYNNGRIEYWGNKVTNSFDIYAVRTYGTGNTSLTIKNESFTEITDVTWQNITFSGNQYDNSIKSGTTVTKSVQPGAGYIFFKRKTNPIIARTKELVVIGDNQQQTVVFLDNTLVVEVNNPNNYGLLNELQSTVVWYDDAEGEILPYFLRQDFVGYYNSSGGGLPVIPVSSPPSNLTRNFYLVKNGFKSIAIGGTTSAKLHLKLNLDKKAKLSFWFANKKNGTAGTTFTINAAEKAKWITDTDWSFISYDLGSGENNLIWEKKDGYISGTAGGYYYFSMDDLLIYYTE
jgi:hypothetical protein